MLAKVRWILQQHKPNRKAFFLLLNQRIFIDCSYIQVPQSVNHSSWTYPSFRRFFLSLLLLNRSWSGAAWTLGWTTNARTYLSGSWIARFTLTITTALITLRYIAFGKDNYIEVLEMPQLSRFTGT